LACPNHCTEISWEVPGFHYDPDSVRISGENCPEADVNDLDAAARLRKQDYERELNAGEQVYTCNEGCTCLFLQSKADIIASSTVDLNCSYQKNVGTEEEPNICKYKFKVTLQVWKLARYGECMPNPQPGSQSHEGPVYTLPN